MAYTLVEGTFRIVGFEPDGDSLRFAPKNVDLINALNPERLLRPGDSVQLRLECIDALEIHCPGHTELRHQPRAAADAGRARLLELAGFEDVVYAADKVVGCKADDLPGYILTNKLDSYRRRPISYAFAGQAPAGQDGASIFLEPPMLRESMNFALLASGACYPMYYEGAFFDLRAELDKAVAAARAAPTGASIWVTDATSSGVAVPPFARIADEVALWPKLFRRVASFFEANPNDTSLAGFVSWLESDPDPCFDLDRQTWTNLHNFVAFDPATGLMRLTIDPTRLLFKD